jgi:hypothetical protein
VNYLDILHNLGYKLIDGGDHWRANAAYREGDNPTALIIYKETGVWKDFVEDSVYMPFDALISKTIGSNDPLRIREYTKGVKKIESYQKKKTLFEEKTYDPSSLKKLLPHYDFFLDKGIKQEVLEEYRCGLATGGKMYKRIVFPVFRRDGRIHGFSGRTLDPDNSAKWLHIGKKQNWFFPFYNTTKTSDAINDRNRVFLVESVGDSVSLANAGYWENIVSFGLSVSPVAKAKICALPIDKIFICFNNDTQAEKNRGLTGALKQLLSMLDTFDFEKIFICELPKNDFGDMSPEEIQTFIKEQENSKHQDNSKRVLELTQKDPSIKKELAKKFKTKYNFWYG